MTPDQFCYWLQGFFELKKTIDHRDGSTPETMKMIEDHLQTVFQKVTPPFPTLPNTPIVDWSDYTKGGPLPGGVRIIC